MIQSTEMTRKELMVRGECKVGEKIRWVGFGGVGGRRKGRVGTGE